MMYSASEDDSRNNSTKHDDSGSPSNTNENSSLIPNGSRDKKYSSANGDNNNVDKHDSRRNQREEEETWKKQQGWMIDRSTLRFTIIIVPIVFGLTIAFSIIANNERSNNSNSTNSNSSNNGHETPAPATPVPFPFYDHLACFSHRNFTMWRSFPVVNNNLTQKQKQKCLGDLKLVRGQPFPCTSDSNCQLGIPNYCVYGSTNALTCHKGFCALKTFSLPVSFHKPGSGICPLNSSSFEPNSTSNDYCGDLLTTKQTTSSNFLEFANKPMICATSTECASGTSLFAGGIRCSTLSPILYYY
jgi:hypothetical protein